MLRCWRLKCTALKKLGTKFHSRFHSRSDGELGVVLLQVIVLTVVFNLIAFTMVSLSLRSVQIENLHHKERQTYWRARSTALSVLKTLESGGNVATTFMTTSKTGTTSVTVTSDNVVLVKVDAKTAAAEARIQFQFNKATQEVMSWMDNAGTGS